MGNGVPLGRQQPPYRLHLKHHLSPGDVVVMTAAVESLHRQYPNQYRVSVDTTCPEVWAHNPGVCDVPAHECHIVVMHYDAISSLSRRDVSFMGAFTEHLAKAIGRPLSVQVKAPCLYLGPDEGPLDATAGLGPYVVVNAGRKSDFTAKWAGTAIWQEVADALRARGVAVVQVGEASPGHHHPRLAGAVDLVGRTSLRELFRLTRYAVAAAGPVSLLMHTAAAFDVPYVALAGGREEPGWEAYSSTHYLHTMGMLPCCAEKACWKSRTVPLGDGSNNDHSLCRLPVLNGGDTIPRCLQLVGSRGVITALERVLDARGSSGGP